MYVYVFTYKYTQHIYMMWIKYMNFITGNMLTYTITIASAQHILFFMRQCIFLNKFTFLYHFYFKEPQKTYLGSSAEAQPIA